MQFDSFNPKDIQKKFWKTIDFAENLEITQIAEARGRGDGGFMFFESLWRSACEN